jgi:trehalose 6-phosphate synthase
MRRPLRFLAVLVLGLGALTWIAYVALTRTTQRWFEVDAALRAHLVVGSARPSLLSHWGRGDVAALTELLAEITRDERIMATAVCGADQRRVAATDGFPRELSCRAIGRELQKVGEAGGQDWSAMSEVPSGMIHVSAIPLSDSANELGFTVLVHDMSYVSRREAATRNMLLVAFFVLATGASVVALVAARLFWRDWTSGLRRALRGEDQHPQYQPLLRDVRELAERLASDRDVEQQGLRWTPERLKAALEQHLQGERIVIVANREPYIHERASDGTIRVQRPASGLVTALEPVMRACSGVWVAHGSGSADRDTADSNGRVRVPPGEESYVVRRIWLSEAEETGYYYGISNEGLWPLCHIAHTRPVFRASDWGHYHAINRRFADAVCEEVDTDDPIILVQDYHLAFAPRMIRERLPRATIITFWHIPWPNAERFGICPYRNELIEGLLGSSIIGFHTQQHCNNYLDAVDMYVESRIDREHNAVIQRARRTLVRAYPISIEWPVRPLEGLPDPEECKRLTFEELGLRPDALLGVGIDRLDYTKGIEERLLAVERLLERFPEHRGRFTFAQLAAPSRTRIGRYQDLNAAVEATAARINERFGDGNYRPIVLLRTHHEPSTVYRFYRAARICYVSSLHDGMNLVAKEFVAARDDEQGVLVLSQFTGAARELTEALIVNPYDLEQASGALAMALGMPAEEQRARMHAMRMLIREFNVYRWAGRMLMDAAQLRRKERLVGRLSRDLSDAIRAG